MVVAANCRPLTADRAAAINRIAPSITPSFHSQSFTTNLVDH